MRSPAAAIRWELYRRHRVGLLVLAAFFALAAVIRLFFLPESRVHFTNDLTFALAVPGPLTASFVYFLAVFSFGLSGDLAARQSIYPPRMFTLPVTTSGLAGWPMLYGCLASAALWFVVRLLGVWPHGVAVPVIWPALLGASLMAWTQALTWMPYGLTGLRVIVTVLWLASIDVIVMIALDLHATEGVMLALLAPHVPLAYVVARAAVARARRGDVPNWSLVGRRDQLRPTTNDQRPTFASPAAAQTWLEWRQHGRALPALVAIVLPFELALLFLFHGTPAIVFEILVFVLLTPSFLSAFVAATVSRWNASFAGTRPLTNASLIAAKLKATAASTLVTWLLVGVATPIALHYSGAAPAVIDWLHDVRNAMGLPRAIVLVALTLAAFVASTWKLLVQSLYLSLSGREWVTKASVFVAMALLAVVPPLAQWTFSSRVRISALWNALPWIAAGLVGIKLAAAFWVAMRLRARGVCSDRALLLGVAAWDVAVFALGGMLMWLLPSLLVRAYFIALIAVLAVPLVRLSAAPLALAWNRHR